MRPRSRLVRWLLVISAAVVLVGVVGFTGYVGIAGSDDFLMPARSEDCRTPSQQYGWPYEAVNYDRQTDEGLAPIRAERDGRQVWTCTRTDRLGDAGSLVAVAGSEVVAPDGTRIAAWYIPSADDTGPTGPTVLVVHGRSSNKSEYLHFAAPLHDRFNLVVMDLRNAGQSSTADTTLGVREREDVRAIIDWIERTKAPSWIGGLGTSLGAASLLAAAVDDPRLDALILDSMHADVVTAWGNGVAHLRGLPAQPSGWVIITVASLRTGVDIRSVDPVGLIGGVAPRPILLTHGGRDPLDPPHDSLERNRRAAIGGGVAVEVFVCPPAVHAAAPDACPADWASTIASFFPRVAHGEG